MREILFRGKTLEGGHWIDGDLRHWPSGSVGICDRATNRTIKVDHETVGQYTGYTDMYGKPIFEGDIVESCIYDKEDGYGVVCWYDGAFEIHNENFCGTFHDNYLGGDFEVIGNIHDNPSLVQEG